MSGTNQCPTVTFEEPKTWTVRGFLDYFMQIHNKMEDRAFCFVFGAGASVKSGIPAGAKLVDQWLKDLYRRENDWKNIELNEDQLHHQIAQWATPEKLDIQDFDYERRAEFYPQIYERRFSPDPEEGNAFLECLFEEAEPSPGYFVLGRILTRTKHCVVITTNFDDLVAQSIFRYPNLKSKKFPLVIGHESLTIFVRARLRRPLVAKIHNDRLLNPKNTPDETKVLAAGWVKALTELFCTYTPVVIGYGGNDGSLMGFWDSLPTGAISGRMIWCYYGEEPPRDQIRHIVAKHCGALVQIDGFDELMIELGNKLDLTNLTKNIEEHPIKMLKDYKSQFARLQRLTAKKRWPELLRQDIKPIEWWQWVRAASGIEKDPKRQEQCLLWGIDEFPKSPEALGNMAIYKYEIQKKIDEAQKYLDRAIDVAKSNKDKAFKGLRENYDKFTKLIHKRNSIAMGRYFVRAASSEADENLVNIIRATIKDDVNDPQRLFEAGNETPHLSVMLVIASILLEMDHADDADKISARAFKMLASNGANQLMAEIVFFRAILAQVMKRSDQGALGRLKSMLKEGFSYSHNSFYKVFDYERYISIKDIHLYEAIIHAINNSYKTLDLEDNYPRWKKLQLITIDKDWPTEEVIKSKGSPKRNLS